MAAPRNDAQSEEVFWVAPQAPQVLFAVLQRASASEEAVAHACEELRATCACAPALAADAVAAGALPALGAVLRRERLSAATAGAALAALCVVADSPAAHEPAREPQALALLGDLLAQATRPACAGAAHQAAALFCAFMLCREGGAVAVHARTHPAGAIPWIIGALRAHAADGTVCIHAFLALDVIMGTDESAQAGRSCSCGGRAARARRVRAAADARGVCARAAGAQRRGA
jgi:hypothetical protein